VKLDVNAVREQFPQFSDEPRFVYCANAGGSYVARQVLEHLDYYNRHLRVQPYSPFASSREAGLAMDRARSGWARALNIHEDELTIGPSTSMNSYVMAQALGVGWDVGDEIVVTQQDHEANQGVWRRMAEARGATVREWPVDSESGMLDTRRLWPLLGEKTRWVFFTQCSNVIGMVNPVQEVVAGIRRRSAARVCVDAVAHAPHQICDLGAMDVDIYLFSLYKVFGPHQGLMYLRASMQEELPAQCHFFLRSDAHKRFNPAGPQHAQVAACQGVLDYFDWLFAHHGGPGGLAGPQRMQWLHVLMSEHESELAAPLLDCLQRHPKVKLLGSTDPGRGDRSGTIAFQPLERSSADVAADLYQRGIGAERGHFYAHRLLQNLGIDPAEGVVRLSLLHYNSAAEVERILSALETALA
jgi:selenocysteine lyase/cysteine desulfurase